MKKKFLKIEICLGLVILLLIPCVITNVSAITTVGEIQENVEGELEMELHLCVQLNITQSDNPGITVGYDLLFMPLDNPKDPREHRYFEAYYDGCEISVEERFLEDSIYEESEVEIISLDPLSTQQTISLTGEIMMTTGTPIIIKIRTHNQGWDNAIVTAKGLFFATYGKMRHVWDFSYETHWGWCSLHTWNHYDEMAPDRSWGKVYAHAGYIPWLNPSVVWNVWALVKQYADYLTHWEKDGGVYMVD